MYRRHKSVGNQTRGFWLDTDCANILVENILCCDNLTDGIFVEASQFLVTTTLSSPLWQKFVDSLTSDGNLWWNPQKTVVFQVAAGTSLDFSGWKSATGRDANSLWVGPRFVDPAHDNFSLLPDSPLLGMGWPSLPNAAS